MRFDWVRRDSSPENDRIEAFDEGVEVKINGNNSDQSIGFGHLERDKLNYCGQRVLHRDVRSMDHRSMKMDWVITNEQKLHWTITIHPSNDCAKAKQTRLFDNPIISSLSNWKISTFSCYFATERIPLENRCPFRSGSSSLFPRNFESKIEDRRFPSLGSHRSWTIFNFDVSRRRDIDDVCRSDWFSRGSSMLMSEDEKRIGFSHREWNSAAWHLTNSNRTVSRRSQSKWTISYRWTFHQWCKWQDDFSTREQFRSHSQWCSQRSNLKGCCTDVSIALKGKKKSFLIGSMNSK